jgi:2-succinyl-5-enolpyruvyl-6-hydroxy-3-cyclohexene-1-carboxylate synthase
LRPAGSTDLAFAAVDSTNRNTALASALTEELARSGVRRAVISPGSRSTPLAVALWRQREIEVAVILDERSAGFFALGTALATGVPAAVLCTSGSAASNLHPAVVEADEASVPLIVLTADRPPELRDIGAGQTIDQLKLYGDAVRWFSEIGTHEADDDGLLHFRSVACRGYASAIGDPRPGPVHLNVPWREPLAPVQVEGQVAASDPLALQGRGDAPLQTITRAVPRADEVELDRLAERIESSARGLIVAGRQTDTALAGPVAELATAAGFPILAEPTSQLRRGPHDRSLLVTTYDAIARDRPSNLEPGLVIRFGDLPTSKPLRQWLTAIDDLDQIVIDPAGEWREPTRRAATLLRADPGVTARALSERLSRLRPGAATVAGSPFAEAWLEAERAVREAVDGRIDSLAELSEPGVWASLGRMLRDGDSVFAGSSMPVRDLEAFLRPGPEGVRFASNRGANGIDGLVSTSAGLAAGRGSRTWAVLGDLAVFHDIGGLAALRHAPELRLIVIDNSGGGIFHFLPQAEAMPEDEFEALLGTPSGLRPEDAAALFGLGVATPGSPSEFEEALAEDARMIVVRTDRTRNLELHRELSEAAADAVAGTARA